MDKKIFFIVVLTLLFAGLLMSTFRIHPVKAWEGGTIYIRGGGAWQPISAPISYTSPDIYTLTGDIVSTADDGSAIVVETDNIVLDGAGHTLQGPTEWSTGIDLTGRSGVTIKDMTIETFTFAIKLYDSDLNVISGIDMITDIGLGIAFWANSDRNTAIGNNIISYNFSIHLSHSINNNIKRNNIDLSGGGIGFDSSDSNTISGNNITHCEHGVVLYHSSTLNKFYHNNFMMNTQHVDFRTPDANFWDDGYPSGGNFWDSLVTVDSNHGLNQDIPGKDGIADNPNPLNALNIDGYPLMNPWHSTIASVRMAGRDCTTVIVSDATITDVHTIGNTLRFTASGPPGTRYMIVIFPIVVPTPPDVLINGAAPSTAPTINRNGTHWFIYCEFPTSTVLIEIRFGPYPPVGGFSVTIDNSHSLSSQLPPHVDLILAIIVATSIVATSTSAAYIKYKKKQ